MAAASSCLASLTCAVGRLPYGGIAASMVPDEGQVPENTRTPVATVAVALIAGMSPLMRWAVLSLGVARWQVGGNGTLIWQAEGETHFVNPTSLIARQAQCGAYGLFTVSESSCYSDSPAPGGSPPP